MHFSLRSRHLFWFGAVLFSIFFVYRIHLILRLSFDEPLPVIENFTEAPLPVQVSIDIIRLNLPIYPTLIKDNTWQIAPNGISYLVSSHRPGQSGSIILYGHNSNDYFGPIRWLKTGAEVKITTSDQVTKIYKVSETLTVTPSDINVLMSDSETLILYTCTGLFDRQRFIVKAIPVQ